MNTSYDIATDSAHPINRVEWRLAATLSANNYNPNLVFGPELKLLETSLVMTGWLQPILILPDGTIIDGFHRHMIARQSPRLLERDAGFVPCCILPLTRAEAMALTVRINRAKGSHAALRMHELVCELVDEHGWTRDQVALEIGATLKEVDLLRQDGVFAMKNIKDYAYSKAWIPKENGKASKDSPDAHAQGGEDKADRGDAG